MVDIKGKITDTNNQPLSGITIEAFERELFSNFDRILAQPGVTDSSGSFNMVTSSILKPNMQNIYLTITDPLKKFVSVKFGQNMFNKIIDVQGNVKWKSDTLDDIENVNVVISLQPRKIPDEKYEAVVIGSGFGGTIVSLSLANKFEKDGKQNKVCILERGQWWVSHEMPIDASSTTDGKPTIRQYLEENNIPYSTWAYPDNLNGLFQVFGNSRPVNKVRGVYDFRTMKNVHIITASGIGGGSLVYTNVTEKPDNTVYENWPTEVDGKQSLEKYFDVAENFIGVNTISTTAGLGKFKLQRAHVFQNAANAINSSTHKLMNEKDLDARLSITDVSTEVFNSSTGHPNQEDISKYSKQNNVCQRQGRCVLGCIPGARHTLNKQIHKYLSGNNPKPIDVFPLCEVIEIQESGDSEFKYKIDFIGYRDNNTGNKGTILSKMVILAAGTLGSTEILLKSKNLNLSDKIGQRFSTNGDLLGVINPTKELVDASRGPITTSIARFNNLNSGKFSYSIEDEGIPKMFAELFATLFDIISTQKGNSIIPNNNLIKLFNEFIINKINDTQTMNWLLKLIDGIDLTSSNVLRNKLIEIINDIKGISLDDKRRTQAPEERVSNILMLGGIGIDDPKAQLVIDGNDNNRLDLKEPYDLDQQVFKDIIDTMKLFAKEIGRDGENSLAIPFWDKNNKAQFVLHPLGGCPMGKDASEGVVNSMGKIFKNKSGTDTYDDLYVIDGSIIPSPLGVNPSLTISALAFRIAEQITGDKKHWP